MHPSPHPLRHAAGAVALALCGFGAQAATPTLTRLAGVTGGTVASTAVLEADLSSPSGGSFQSLVIADATGLGGSPGRFHGSTHLYIGEVGDNGEISGGTIRPQATPLVPEPGTWALLLSGAVAAVALQRRRSGTGFGR